MAITKKEFTLKGTHLRSTTEKILKVFSNFFADNGMTPLLTIDNINPVTHTAVVHYLECSDGGNFITFGGVMVNTETLYAALGYTANNASYIPVFSVVELLNLAIFSMNENILDKDDAKFIIESFKLERDAFDIFTYCKEKLEGSTPATTYRYSSVILNYVDDSTITITPTDPKYKTFYAMDSTDLWESITYLIKRFVGMIDDFGKEFFGNFISEEDMQSSIKSYTDYDATLQFKALKYEPKYQSAYLKNIKDRGVDPEFALEVSSIGFGINRRREVLQSTVDGTRDLALLSSGAYVTAFGGETIQNINNQKILLYNLMDILRGIGKDQYMFFGLDTLTDSGDDSVYNALINNLGITTEMSNLGAKAKDDIRVYKSKMLKLVDKGALYSRDVPTEQGILVPFSARELTNSGKLVQPLLSRVIGNFK